MLLSSNVLLSWSSLFITSSSEGGLTMVFEYTELSDAPSFNNNAEPFTFRIVLLNTELLEDSLFK
jgi:hypothetical protein